jgi:dTDP-4-amino-4,6-dideoxygalactose transaminase
MNAPLRTGSPALPMVDLQAQYRRLKPQILQRIEAVLDHGRYIMGPEVAELEAQLAAFTGARHAVGVASGSDALLIALLAQGLRRDDAVFVPAFTFPATAEAILLAGATPVFVDVDLRTFNIDPQDLARQIERVLREGWLHPRAVIAVDLFGWPADYDAIAAVAEPYDMFVLADAAQSLGATVGNRAVGTLAPVTATSFFPAKPLGCYGDGGALFTDDDDLAAAMRSIRTHGAGRDKYDIERLGLNGRLDTLQAAILLAKLEVFADELAARQRVADAYDAALRHVVTIPFRPPGTTSAWAQYSILVDDRDGVAARLKDAGVPTAVYYPRPLHQQPAYASHGQGAGSLPASEALCRRILSLPMHPYLTPQDCARVCESVDQALGAVQASPMATTETPAWT